MTAQNCLIPLPPQSCARKSRTRVPSPPAKTIPHSFRLFTGLMFPPCRRLMKKSDSCFDRACPEPVEGLSTNGKSSVSANPLRSHRQCLRRRASAVHAQISLVVFSAVTEPRAGGTIVSAPGADTRDPPPAPHRRLQTTTATYRHR